MAIYGQKEERKTNKKIIVETHIYCPQIDITID